MSELTHRAAEFAEKAHGSINQCRRNGAPYIVHPQSVAHIVAEHTDDQAMIAAAWLHDVVEDTPVKLAEIEEQFGSEVAELVENLTDIALPSDGNRAARKAIDREHTSRASARAKTVKLADILANLGDLRDVSTRFAMQYIRESEALLHVLKEGDKTLFADVEQALKDTRKEIEKRR